MIDGEDVNKDTTKVVVVGLGYIGLPTSCFLASRGLDVTGIDVNQNLIDKINSGKCHINEPHLEDILQKSIASNNFRASKTPTAADVFIIAVPTPVSQEGRPDISYVESAVESIIPVIQNGNLIIIESTCPVGTTEKMLQKFKEARTDLELPQVDSNSSTNQLFLSYCPERVFPGNILNELENNDRVIGGISKSCSQKALNFYQSLNLKGTCTTTNSRTAEFTKLIENSYRLANIAFANEVSLIAEERNINSWEAIKLANRHPRVNILNPGPGVGGHCIAVDPLFLTSEFPNSSKLINKAFQVNKNKQAYVKQKVINEIQGYTSDSTPKVCFLGITFKPDVEDLRDSPSLSIVLDVARETAIPLTVCDPFVKSLPNQFNSAENVTLNNDITNVVSESDIIVILVKHSIFSIINQDILQSKTVIDSVGLLEQGN